MRSGIRAVGVWTWVPGGSVRPSSRQNGRRSIDSAMVMNTVSAAKAHRPMSASSSTMCATLISATTAPSMKISIMAHGRISAAARSASGADGCRRPRTRAISSGASTLRYSSGNRMVVSATSTAANGMP